MNKIKQLSKDTIEKIAAGEVIERPESIVKEAVENSIDANSTSILIEIKSGGKEYIRITDNGDGISYNDMEMAFKKHCTSKILSFNDIYNLSSCGFRGEALNSIANVSIASLISKVDGEHAYEIKYEFGEMKNKSKTVANTGTSLIVRSLFDNMPVRKRLLASDRTEENRIRSLVERFAVGYPNIAFKFIANSRTVINTSGSGDLKKAIFEVFGNNIVKDLIELECNKIKGFISNFNLYSNNSKSQMIFINNRIVYNEDFSKVIESQYFGKIPAGKKPIFFLFIDVGREEIDVNIHPSKKYVKITFNDILLNELKESISNFLNHNQNFSFNEGVDESIEFKVYDENKSNYIPNAIIQDSVLNYREHKKSDINFNFSELENSENNDKLYIQNEMNISVPNIVIVEDNTEIIVNKYNLENIFPDKIIGNYNKVIGLIFGIYLLIENFPNELVLLIDLKKSISRNLYDLYTHDINNNKVPVQSFLDPLVYDLDYKDFELVYKYNDSLFNAGFDVSRIGESRFALRGIPMYLSDSFKKDDFIEIVKNISIDKKNLIPNIVKKVSLIASNEQAYLNKLNAESIFIKLLNSSNPYTSPSGQPIIKILTKSEFIKRFDYE